MVTMMMLVEASVACYKLAASSKVDGICTRVAPSATVQAHYLPPDSLESLVITKHLYGQGNERGAEREANDPGHHQRFPE